MRDPIVKGSLFTLVRIARKDGPFLSIEDLQRRGRAGSSVVETLRTQGALQGLSETNQISMF